MSGHTLEKGAKRLEKSDYDQLAGFRYQLRIFMRESEDRARRAGVTIQQYLALLAIKGYPDREQVNVKELAERLQIKHHSAVGLVDRMEKGGLVARRQSAQDRRNVLISLTQAGEELLERLAAENVVQLRSVETHLRALFNDPSLR